MRDHAVNRRRRILYSWPINIANGEVAGRDISWPELWSGSRNPRSRREKNGIAVYPYVEAIQGEIKNFAALKPYRKDFLSIWYDVKNIMTNSIKNT